jgi:hypothetical protein
MSLWVVDAVLSGFRSRIPDEPLQIFRLLLGIACLIKVGENLIRGGWSTARDGSYGAYRIERTVPPHLRNLALRIYQPVAIVRLVAALGLILGLAPRVMAAVTAAGLLYELLRLYRNNTVYLALCCICLVFAGHLSGFGTTTTSSASHTWAQFLIVFITIDMYLNSAWLKARSQHFRSGLLLAQWTDATRRLKSHVPFGEFWYPEFFTRTLGRYTPGAMRFWRVTAISVIALEATLPFGLLFRPVRPYAVVLGILMHVAFTALLPRKLLPFSIASTASYILF